jgi:hypothetical protein
MLIVREPVNVPVTFTLASMAMVSPLLVRSFNLPPSFMAVMGALLAEAAELILETS